MSAFTRRVSRRKVLAVGAGISAGVAADSMVPGRSLASPRHIPAQAAAASLVRRGESATAEGGRLELSTLVACPPSVHVARRLTYGATPAAVATARREGIAAFVDSQLRPSAIADDTCDGYLRRFPLLGLAPGRLRAAVPTGSFEQMAQMATAALVRATWSERQLFEMMVEFWWNHFNVGLPSSDVWDLAGEHDNRIRAGALGRFADLLHSMAHSPALLRSLNQDQSVRANPNENYGRELLELHTVSVGAGYSQHDVHQSSLLLTGLGILPDGCTAAYIPAGHYLGRVEVMSFSDANRSTAGGAGLIARYLDYLAHHRATATHLATKLAVRFVCDDPPRSLVAGLAHTYLAGGTAIVPVLRRLFASSEFLKSAGQKMRRPVEAVAAALRVLDYRLDGPGTDDVGDLGFVLQIMGQRPMGWVQPNGYPDVAPAWVSASATQAAWATHLRLAGGWWTKQLAFPGVAALLGHPAPSERAGDVLDKLAARLLFARLAVSHKAALLEFMGRGEDEPIGQSGVEGLGMLAKVLLDSPYFAVR
ncbi:MAG: DUF1800 domain-containing protein [Acidimicrobiales bacterium]